MTTSTTIYDVSPDASKIIKSNEYYTWARFDEDGIASDTVMDVVCYRRRKLSNGMVRLYLRYPTRSVPELDLVAMNKRIHDETRTK